MRVVRLEPGLVRVAARSGTVLAAAAAVGLLAGAAGTAPLVLQPSQNAPGTVVAFDSIRALVPGDTNGIPDVFVRDRPAGVTERASVGSRGEQANGWSWSPALSGDGRFVAFGSDASNLVMGDSNARSDVFVRDLGADVTERVSVGAGGVQGSEESYSGAISADGRYVAFTSEAANLVQGDTNGTYDVLLRDRVAGTTELVSVGLDGLPGNGGSEMPDISADGRYVTFSSLASNLVSDDDDLGSDIFVRDRASGTTELISVSTPSTRDAVLSGSPVISGDGRYVAYMSMVEGLLPGGVYGENVFVRDRVLGTTELASLTDEEGQPNDDSWDPSISADGRFVVFWSAASNVVLQDTNAKSDVFLRDRRTSTTRRVSLTKSGGQMDGFKGVISADARTVAFSARATNPAPGDVDTFIRDVAGHTTEQVSVATTPARAGPIRVQPQRPRAGRRLTVTFMVTQNAAPVAAATVTCSAAVAGRPLRAIIRGYQNGRARCSWTLPTTSAGRTIRGRVVATSPNGRVQRAFSARIT